MVEDNLAFDSQKMESIVVEDASLNQSEVKQLTSTDPDGRPTPFMVPVVFEKIANTETASDNKEGSSKC